VLTLPALRNAIYGGALLVVTVLLAAFELTVINGNVAALILVSGALAALSFSALKLEGIGVSNREELIAKADRLAAAYYAALEALPDGDPERTRYRTNGSIELTAPGGITAKIPKRLLGENTLLLLLIVAVGYFGYKHHESSEEWQRKIYEATIENTYVLSLPQAEREKLNISVPDSLRRKMRRE
jgi:hypothetical protein